MLMTRSFTIIFRPRFSTEHHTKFRNKISEFCCGHALLINASKSGGDAFWEGGGCENLLIQENYILTVTG